MLQVVGARADGWLPSLGYLQAGDLARGNALIDDAAASAGRDPHAVRRLLNVSGRFSAQSGGLLDGPPQQWAEQLADLALSDGISAFILGTDDPAELERFGNEVAPAVRALVSEHRAQPTPDSTAGVGTAPESSPRIMPERVSSLGVATTPDPGIRLSEAMPWDEASRPHRPPASDVGYTERGRAVGQHLIDVHDHLRSELTQVRNLIDQVREGAVQAAHARSVLNELTMRQNDWTLGAYCAAYCRVVTTHHELEDDAIFPHLRAQDPDLNPVLDRLVDEHKIIHGVLDGVDRALVEFISYPDDFTALQGAVDLLTDTLLSHLSYEEQEIVEPLARLGFYPGQV
jgi:hypothetical protein